MERKRSYKALCILDTRGYDQEVEKLHDLLNQAVEKVGGKVSEVKSLGRIDFARMTEKDHPGDTYLEIFFEGPTGAPDGLQNELRLERRVKRIMIEKVD